MTLMFMVVLIVAILLVVHQSGRLNILILFPLLFFLEGFLHGSISCGAAQITILRLSLLDQVIFGEGNVLLVF